jgi:hypothetical protein
MAPKALIEKDTLLNPAEPHSINVGVKLDRRRNLRIQEQFPVKVRGVDVEGRTFDIDTVVENLSSGGLYLKFTRRVALGERLFFVIYMSTGHKEEKAAPIVAAHGKVIRAEMKGNGSIGMGVAFYNHRFL